MNNTSVTFEQVAIGNKFMYHNEWFVRMAQNNTAIGNNGRLVAFNASRHVLIPVEKDRAMCA